MPGKQEGARPLTRGGHSTGVPGAVVAGAGAIVTLNITEFPTALLSYVLEPSEFAAVSAWTPSSPSLLVLPQAQLGVSPFHYTAPLILPVEGIAKQASCGQQDSALA